MQVQVANRIEQGFGRGEAFEPRERLCEEVPTESVKTTQRTVFEPYRGKSASPAPAGSTSSTTTSMRDATPPTNAHGKREVHTVYTKTREECEALLEKMIVEG